MIFFLLKHKALRNMLENLCELVADNLDILCIAETKLEPSEIRNS